jgi:uncharacterized membrane protein YraQ (UPF0718 family)
MKKKNVLVICLIAAFCLFIIFSFIIDFKPGKDIFDNFLSYSTGILLLLPFIFILVGLFEVWIKRETVEKHLGADAGLIGYLWAIILGGLTIGPMIAALPIAHTLAKKGARLSIIFTYIGAAAVCRIPMTIFEASYVGVLFTVVRYVVSLPLIILSSILMEIYFKNKNYSIADSIGSCEK